MNLEQLRGFGGAPSGFAEREYFVGYGAEHKKLMRARLVNQRVAGSQLVGEDVPPPSSLRIHDFQLDAVGPVRAWVAKISRISPVRSSTCAPVARSRLRAWLGESS